MKPVAEPESEFHHSLLAHFPSGPLWGYVQNLALFQKREPHHFTERSALPGSRLGQTSTHLSLTFLKDKALATFLQGVGHRTPHGHATSSQGGWGSMRCSQAPAVRRSPPTLGRYSSFDSDYPIIPGGKTWRITHPVLHIKNNEARQKSSA